MKNIMIAATAMCLLSGVVHAQDAPKKVAKMEAKELKHDAKVAKKEAKTEGDYMKADSAKQSKHEAKMLKKTVKNQ
ncbi:hypothetical protein [Spirosoma radiotolerans]|uniref:Pentapeptide MXKDX repeat protein n=1 Tax=Spirosoma radiotolerans TaxID=1379870 RepID=A0A0E3ZTB7_9BACT|nr:hypothetical protein [Spirosoma radiotolerans]AKD53749.1 hypothetical protein SD10_01375 [Spirosoma radiotolerans]